MPLVIELFPEAAIALQKELLNHQPLLAQLNAAGEEASMEERFGIIAAYAGIVLDGYYNEAAMERLFEIVLRKLKDKSVLRVH